MRDYFRESNLLKALALGVVTTAMALPRIWIARVDLRFFAAAALLGMTLVGGAATAWSGRAGMCGWMPGRRRTLAGLGLAALLGLAVVPVYGLLDPQMRLAFARCGDARLFDLQYPGTARGVWAMVLWSAGFETVLFQAAVVSFFARVTNSQQGAIAGAVLLRALVGYRHLCTAQVWDGVPLLLVSGALATAAGAFLFARFGLLPAMLFAAILAARHAW